MTPQQIELIVRRAATHGLDATGVAELERDLAIAGSPSDVPIGAHNGVWSVPVTLPAIRPPSRHRDETTLSPWQTPLRDPEPYGVIS